MYLSRVQVADQDGYRMQSLTHLGAYHNWIEQCFPDEIKARVRNRHLWRIDQLGGKKYLLLLSDNKPDLEKLTTYGVPGTAMIKDYDSFLDRIERGKKYRFRLSANPTQRITQRIKEPGKKPVRKKGRVVPHVTIQQQKKWLADRQEKLGFKFIPRETDQGIEPQFEIVDRSWKMLYRKKKRSVKLSCVTFEGLVEVTDPDKFKAALRDGIGREKAYGMGLMTIIPI